MEEMKQTTVVMTAEEKAEFEAFQREKAKKAAEEKAKNDREMYKQMVDEEIANSIPVLLGISEQIKASKQPQFLRQGGNGLHHALYQPV